MSNQTLEWFAKKLNPKIRGWINYYARFHREKAHDVFYYLNGLIRKWMKNKYKIVGKKRSVQKVSADTNRLSIIILPLEKDRCRLFC
jgi:hypothetical protein